MLLMTAYNTRGRSSVRPCQEQRGRLSTLLSSLQLKILHRREDGSVVPTSFTWSMCFMYVVHMNIIEIGSITVVYRNNAGTCGDTCVAVRGQAIWAMSVSTRSICTFLPCRRGRWFRRACCMRACGCSHPIMSDFQRTTYIHKTIIEVW